MSIIKHSDETIGDVLDELGSLVTKHRKASDALRLMKEVVVELRASRAEVEQLRRILCNIAAQDPTGVRVDVTDVAERIEERLR